MKKAIFSLLCLGMMTTASAQTSVTTSEMTAMYASKTYNTVSIHDPSIVYNPSDKIYYILGSHMGIGKSSDLVNWSSIANGHWVTMPNWWENYQNGDILFNGKPFWEAFKSCPTHEVQVKRGTTTTTETLGSFDAAAFCSTYSTVGDSAWVKGDMWAPDIIYNPNMKKWCMYLSLNGDNWASVVILLTSDYPDHGFTYEAPIVFGGFNGSSYSGKSVNYKNTDLQLVLGTQSSLPSKYNKGKSWGTYYPNCIDPCSFFDEDGELWLIYGSWSGGIYSLKLDKNTGLRDYTYTYTDSKLGSYSNTGDDQYFGKKIAGGYYVSGEGPYIQHIGNYYYLFVSYGGYAPNGGYEMRIFRSDSPTGPFKDASGNLATYTSGGTNFGPKATTNRGMKIIGAFNNWGTMTTGECAEGHNSVTLDPDGNAYVVYHTKFNDGTAGHQVRVRQLFQNENGWLCASPFRYTGLKTTQSQIESSQLFTAEQIAGTYNIIIHPYKLDYANYAEATPVKVTLSADGSVTGAMSGSWIITQEGKSFIKLALKPATSGSLVYYYGVLCEQNVDGYADMPALCITAVSTGGVPVWAYKLQPKAALSMAFSKVNSYLTTGTKTISTHAPYEDNVTSVYTCTEKDASGSWVTSNTLSEDGIFTPTADGSQRKIKYTITSGDYYYKRSLALTVKTAIGSTYYPVSTYLNTTSAWWTNFSKDDYTINAGETMKFSFYNYSSKAYTYHNWCLYGANATHGDTGYKEYFGLRADSYDNTAKSSTGFTNDFDMSAFKNDMDSAKVDMIVSYTAEGVFTMNAIITTKTGKVYHYTCTKTISDAPESLTLFFVNEKSYIDSPNGDINGDVNGDGKVDIDDVREVVNAICGVTITGNADVNGDGNKDVLDVNSVIAIISK